MRLKSRLTLTLTLVTATALIGSFVAVFLLVQRDETTDLDRAILAQGRATAFVALQRDPEHPAVTDGTGELPELYEPATRYAAIYRSDGTVESVTRSLGGSAPSMDALGLNRPVGPDGTITDLTVRGMHLRGVVLPVGAHGQRLLYALTRHTVDDDLVFLFKVFSGLFLAATGITVLIARWLGARLSRDVDNISSAARAVAFGDLSARVGDGARGSTETRALGHDLDNMIVQLDGLMAAQQMFISHAAHELRSPLATLRGELQLALRRPRTALEYHETIEEALSEVELLGSLTENLLVLARVQRTAQPPGESALGEVVADALHMARGPARAKQIVFDEPSPHDLHVSVRGPRADLARALRNLLDNAVEHSSPGGRVTLGAELSGGSVQISVADEGVGIPAEDVPHIFSPFYRGAKDRSGDARGTGLGLAIVREIAVAAGGAVRFDPAHRPGARFLLELPLVSPQPPQDAS